MSHRTQIYLEDDQYQFLKETARAQKKSIAGVIRDWIEAKRKKRADKNYFNDSFWKLRGLFDSGKPDMARNFDDYLYGDKK